MKLYKSPDNKIFGFEEDGSQDFLIMENFVAITEEEAQAIIKANTPPPIPPLEQLSVEQQIAQIQAQLDKLKG